MPAKGLRKAQELRPPIRVAVGSPEGQKLLASLQGRQKGSSRKRFDWADTLYQQLNASILPMPLREYRPIPDRKWRLDLAWPFLWQPDLGSHLKLFVECDGGEYLQASARRHGGAKDCERWNTLTLSGWRGFRFVGSQIKSGEALAFLRRVFDLKEWAHE